MKKTAESPGWDPRVANAYDGPAWRVDNDWQESGPALAVMQGQSSGPSRRSGATPSLLGGVASRDLLREQLGPPVDLGLGVEG